MITRLYSVFDRKAVSFGPLMFFSNDELCLRSMAEAVRDNVVPYPADCDMYHVGAFDTESGRVFGVDDKTLVGRFADFVKKGE